MMSIRKNEIAATTALLAASGLMLAGCGDEFGSLTAFADVALVAGGQSSSEGSTLMITGETEAELSVTGEWTSPEE